MGVNRGEDLGERSSERSGRKAGGKSKAGYYIQEMEYVILAIIRYTLKTIGHIPGLECVMTGGKAARKERGDMVASSIYPDNVKSININRTLV